MKQQEPGAGDWNDRCQGPLPLSNMKCHIDKSYSDGFMLEVQAIAAMPGVTPEAYCFTTTRSQLTQILKSCLQQIEQLPAPSSP